jgi:hypothetical protein
MRDNQTIIVNQKNQGCMGGCGTVFGVVLLIGLAVQYWYISLAVVCIAGGAGVWYLQNRPTVAGAGEPGRVAANAKASACSHCGAAVAGNFCAECGTASTRSCSGCGRRGLMSSFCPDCGSATYLPPTTH